MGLLGQNSAKVTAGAYTWCPLWIKLSPPSPPLSAISPRKTIYFSSNSHLSGYTGRVGEGEGERDIIPSLWQYALTWGDARFCCRCFMKINVVFLNIKFQRNCSAVLLDIQWVLGYFHELICDLQHIEEPLNLVTKGSKNFVVQWNPALRPLIRPLR